MDDARPTPPPRRRRIVWFADLEALVERLDVLERMRGEIGLTTVAPESHLSHTSGFAASAEVAAASPLADWRSRPGLAEHRSVFGVPEPANAVLPGIVGGVDDGPLLRVLDECRRLGLELWGHAGVWCYGGEVFPEFAAVDLWGRPLVPGSLQWGTMFCPSRADLNAWIGRSLADAAARYDLDGWFLDHARYPSPGHGASLFACGCASCEAAAAAHGVSFDAVRADFEALRDDLGRLALGQVASLGSAGPAAIAGWLATRPAVLAWFTVRAQILGDAFAALNNAVQAASPRPVAFGSDVFPPSVALLGGHVYPFWQAAGATYMTGGFGPNIGWGSVGRVTAESNAVALANVAHVPNGLALACAGTLLGIGTPVPRADRESYLIEVERMAAVRGDLPVYPPVAGPPDPSILEGMLRAIVEARLDGAMLAGLESVSVDQVRVISRELSAKLL